MLVGGPDDTFRLPGQSSQEALDRLSHVFPQISGTSAQILVVVDRGSVRTSAVREAVADAVRQAEAIDEVEVAVNPFGKDGDTKAGSTKKDASGSKDGSSKDSENASEVKEAISGDNRAALISIFLSVNKVESTDPIRGKLSTVGTDLQKALAKTLGSHVTVHVGGEAFADRIPHLSPTEGIGLVIAFVILMVMFGSLVTAGVPIVTAIVGVGVSYGFIYTVMRWTQISSTAPMIAVMIGLAVGIDYALFILSRHRDQLRDGLDVTESIARATATAGSAVVFAGLTVFIAFVGLFVPGIPFLTRMGLAGAFGVLVAVAVALTALPAMMAIIGERLRPRARRRRPWPGRRRPAAEKPAEEPAAEKPAEEPAAEKPAEEPAEGHRIARAWLAVATRFPLITIVVIVAGLAVCTLPARNLQLALPNNGTGDPGTPARVTYDTVSEHFGPGYNAPLLVMLDVLATNDPIGVTKAVARTVEKVPGVTVVQLATPNKSGDTSIIEVIPDSPGDSRATGELVHRLRALAPSIRHDHGVESWVTGFTAVTIDISSVLSRALLPFLGIVVGLSLLLLTMVFRSIAIPVKASVGYLLSLGSAFGATTYVFIDGHGASALRVQHVGSVISFLPIILMGVLFGLAMDYEMFLVSRIREDYVRRKDAKGAISEGFIAASRVVVAAALIMFGVFVAFVPEGSATIKPIAFALSVGVFVDAFVIRMTFVPAVLALLGDGAWWLPGWIDRRLPVLDAEGDGIERELRLADWPEPGVTDVVAARGLTLVADDGSRAIDGLSFRLAPGRVLVVEGARPCGKSALLLALGGHVTTIDGDLKVGGDVLPQHNRRARRRVALIPADHTVDVAAEIRRATDDGLPLVLVDDADRVVHPDRRRALAAVLRELGTRGGPAPAVVLTCQDRAGLADMLDEIALDTLLLVPDAVEACS
ncbi:MAG: putative drug exporter of the superfamily [Actinomycetota bacterium]|nr:putative drug exporter of the superfamily [Actinomycetota bacterium]